MLMQNKSSTSIIRDRGHVAVRLPLSCRRLAASNNESPQQPDDDAWPDLASLAAEERERAQGVTDELKSKLKSLFKPKTSTDTSGPGEDQSKSLAVKRSLLSSVMIVISVCIFILQWLDALPMVVSSWKDEPWLTLIATLFIVPDTPAASSWLVNLFDFSTGHWSSFCYGCLVNSGLIPLWLSLATYNESGRVIEVSFGPLMLIIHVLICGLGATFLQVYLQPLTNQVYGISGTAVGAGLVVSCLFHQLREQRDKEHEARQGKAAAAQDPPAPPGGELQTDIQDSSKLGDPASSLILSHLGKWTLALSFLLSLHQPMVNLGGWLGAVIGGAVAGAGASFIVLDALRYAVFGPIVLLFLLSEVLSLASKVVFRAARGLLFFLFRAIVQTAATIIQAFREFFQDKRQR